LGFDAGVYLHRRHPKPFPITEHYSFDQQNISQYPFIRSDAAPRHRFVTAGSIGLPWGFVVASKLTLAHPSQRTTLQLRLIYPNGANNLPSAGIPRIFFGERTRTFQFTKNFDIAAMRPYTQDSTS